VVNIRSVGSGAAVSNVFAVVKLVPLVLFGTLGIIWLAMGKAAQPSAIATDPTLGGWLNAMVLLMFAYGGFESALIPVAEAKDARRDAPFALVTGLVLVTVVYLAAQLTVLVTLSEPAATNRPLAASARVMFGEPGALFITVAALISVYGWVASNMLNVPRLTMAMAERGALPSFFAKIHPVYRTPYVSIIIFALISLALALSAGLLQNLSLSAVSRLLLYGGVCASLPVFRSMEKRRALPAGVEPALFRVTGGVILAAIGVALSLLLATRMGANDAIKMAVVILLGSVHWFVIRGRASKAS
jgi:APA family basic amino acid/polyamine antiporter